MDEPEVLVQARFQLLRLRLAQKQALSARQSTETSDLQVTNQVGLCFRSARCHALLDTQLAWPIFQHVCRMLGSCVLKTETLSCLRQLAAREVKHLLAQELQDDLRTCTAVYSASLSATGPETPRPEPLQKAQTQRELNPSTTVLTIEFSHSVSLFFDAPTMSGMNEGHLCGQSCGDTRSRLQAK